MGAYAVLVIKFLSSGFFFYNFDFDLRYCRIILPFGMRFLIILATERQSVRDPSNGFAVTVHLRSPV